MRLLLTIVTLLLLLSGCAAATSPGGSSFISSKVPMIEKGVTTTAQLLHWFGEPYHREPVSTNEFIWIYSWARPTANTAVVPFGRRNIGTSGYMKTLFLFIRDDTVVNYTYEEGII